MTRLSELLSNKRNIKKAILKLEVLTRELDKIIKELNKSVGKKLKKVEKLNKEGKFASNHVNQIVRIKFWISIFASTFSIMSHIPWTGCPRPCRQDASAPFLATLMLLKGC